MIRINTLPRNINLAVLAAPVIFLVYHVIFPKKEINIKKYQDQRAGKDSFMLYAL